MVIARIDNKLKPEDFLKKSLKLGYDDISFSLEYGQTVEFIGELIPHDIDKNEYRVVIDKIDRRGALSFIRTMGLNDDEERTIILTALKEDYGIENVTIR